MDSICILKRSSFGDIIHALPVASALRSQFPDCKISWITDAGYGDFLRCFSCIDEVIEISFRKMFKTGNLSLYWQRFRKTTSVPFDVLVDLQGTLKSSMMLILSKASEKIGFNKLDAREGFITRFYSKQAGIMPFGLHIIRQNLRVLRLVGLTSEEISWPEMTLQTGVQNHLNAWMKNQKRTEFIAINPFTNWLTKCWPGEHLVKLCKLIVDKLPYTPLILWGPKERKSAEKLVAESAGCAVLAPETDQLQLAALLRRCELYLGGDTGPSHLATALGVPVVMLFGPTDPRRNGPVDPDDKYIWRHLSCKGCVRNKCRLNEKVGECMRLITPGEVLEAIETRIAKI